MNSQTVPLSHSIAASAQPRLLVEQLTDIEAFLRHWDALAHPAPTPFHSAQWLRVWYDTIGKQEDLQPVLLRVLRSDNFASLLLLPLVACRQGRLSIVRPADEGVSDYTGPLLNPAYPIAGEQLPELKAALKSALRGHDVLHVDKMLGHLADQANPLMACMVVRPSGVFGNHIRIDVPWDTWRATLVKEVRKEFERSWRVFQREPEAHFTRARTLKEGLALYERLEAMQSKRMAGMAQGYRLDEPAYSRFYENLLRQGLANGEVIITALMVGGEPAAVLYGVFSGEQYTMLRLAADTERWSQFSPGRLLLKRSIHHMHSEGVTQFDFAIGDYHHKRVFNAQPLPLWDACMPLSGQGQAWVGWWRLRHYLRSKPQAQALVRRWRQARAGR